MRQLLGWPGHARLLDAFDWTYLMGKRAAYPNSIHMVYALLRVKLQCSGESIAHTSGTPGDAALLCSAVGEHTRQNPPTPSAISQLSPVSLLQSLLLRRPALVHCLARAWSVDFKKKRLKFPRLINLPPSACSLNSPD